MTFVLGVSSGIFSAAQEAERLQYAGLYQKAQYCITKGVQFVQIDLESISEFKAPNLKDDMKKLEQLGITFGIHSETRAFGVEIAELDSSIDTDYKFGHERLAEILQRAGDIGSKYVLIHSSESEPFLMLERHMQPSALVDFFGNPLRKFLEREENKWLLDWLVTEPYKNFIWVEIIGETLDEAIRSYFESGIENYKREFRVQNKRPPTQEEISAEENGIRENTKEFVKERIAKMRLLNEIESRRLHFGPERYAYWLIAKWMEKNNDPLWTSILNATIEFFAKSENKQVEEWLKDKGIKQLSIEDENFRKYGYIWVPAVSAKYLWGHLNQDKNPDKRYSDFKPTLKKYKMPLVLETPMAHRGIEEWLRLPNPIQMYHLAKQIGIEYVQLALDLEHMLSIRLDPEKVFDVFPEDAGKYVRVIHAGYPSPLSPAHIPIPFGSDQQVYLYKMYYKLWKKGFGKDKSIEYYLVFERGGGADPVQQSILALRKIVEYLEKDIKPEDLMKHPDFFGISVGEIASMERQWQAIHEHGRDPLKGMIVVSEEEYGFLGRAATEKGKAEIWKKEELR